MRVALYTRVSTTGQDVENQIIQLREVASKRGWTIVAVYADEGISGSKGRDQRPALDAMLKSVTQGKIDLVAAFSVDRLSRSLADLLATLGCIHNAKCDLYLHSQGIDSSNPGGRALFQLMGVFAELERSLIQERVHAGLKRARAQGKILGRPCVAPALVEEARRLRASGMPYAAIAKATALSIGTIHKACRA